MAEEMPPPQPWQAVAEADAAAEHEEVKPRLDCCLLGLNKNN